MSSFYRGPSVAALVARGRMGLEREKRAEKMPPVSRTSTAVPLAPEVKDEVPSQGLPRRSKRRLH